MSRLIHLNGPPGIGKSTVARAYAARRPGTLCCDVDVLRTMIGGWSEDFAHAGQLIRPAAQAFIGGYLARSGDVVFPQLLVDPGEVAKFAQVAADAGAAYVEVMLFAEADEALARFHRRGRDVAEDPWHAHVQSIVADQGGDELLLDYHARLLALLETRPHVVVTSREGELGQTVDDVVAAVDLVSG